MAISALRLEPYRAGIDYPLIVEWWKARGHAALPVDLLPCKGAMVMRDKERLAASFCYLLQDAHAAFITFTVTAPNLLPRLAVEAIKLALRGAVGIAKLNGAKLIFSSTDVFTLDRIYKDVGFSRAIPQQNYFMLLDNAPSDMLGGEAKD